MVSNPMLIISLALWLQTSLESSPTPKFDKDIGITMASLVSASYCSSEKEIMAWKCERAKRVADFVPHATFQDNQDLFAFTGLYQNENIVIVFKGADSHSLMDWVENLKAYSRLNGTDWGPEINVHAGFFRLYQRLRSNITASIKDLLLLHPQASLFTTGHSMGGALASLCAVDLSILFPNTNVSSMTFGSPRVGNHAFYSLARERLNVSWRVTHQRDIVPSLPPLLLDFHHLAREVWTLDLKGETSSREGAGGGPQQTETERRRKGRRRRINGEEMLKGPPPSHELDYYVCDDSGEDRLCHNSVFASSIKDHLTYLNIYMPRITEECS